MLRSKSIVSLCDTSERLQICILIPRHTHINISCKPNSTLYTPAEEPHPTLKPGYLLLLPHPEDKPVILALLHSSHLFPINITQDPVRFIVQRHKKNFSKILSFRQIKGAIWIAEKLLNPAVEQNGGLRASGNPAVCWHEQKCCIDLSRCWARLAQSQR